MKVKVIRATPAQLDWMVLTALCGGPADVADFGSIIPWTKKIRACWKGRLFKPTTDGDVATQIIEREKIETRWIILEVDHDAPEPKKATKGYWQAANLLTDTYGYTGPTMLIAAMRCFVAGRLGDEVDVPESIVYEEDTPIL